MIFIIFLISGAWAQTPNCTSQDLVEKSCQYLREKSETEFIQTPSGGRIKNPYYIKPLSAPSSPTVAGAMGSPEAVAKFDETYAEFELEIDDILESSSIKKLPARSLSFIRTASLAMTYSSFSDTANQMGGYGMMPLKMPVPLDQPKAAIKNVTIAELQKMLGDLDPDVFGKLDQAQKKLQKNLQEKGINPMGLYSMAEGFPTTSSSESEKNKKRQRLAEDFIYAKTKLIEMIRGGKADHQLSGPQKNLIDRINTVSIKDPYSAETLSSPVCANSAENGYYMPTSHSISVCPAMLENPRTLLVGFLGHELGHAIDPCNSRCTHFKADMSFYENRFSAEDDGYKKEDSTSEIIRSFQPDEFDTVRYYPGSASQALFQEAKDKKFLTETIRGLAPSEHPFYSVRQCLVKNEKFDDYSQMDEKYYRESVMASYRRQGIKPKKSDIEENMQIFRKNKECARLPFKTTEVNEMMADVYGSHVSAQYFKEQKSKLTLEDAIGSILDIGNICVNKSPQTEMTNPLLASHPLSRRRAESIFLKTPGIAEAFGCQLKPVSSCLENFRKTQWSVGSTQVIPRTNELQSDSDSQAKAKEKAIEAFKNMERGTQK